MKKSQAIKAINEISYKAADSIMHMIKFKTIIPASLEMTKADKELLIYVSDSLEGDNANKRIIEMWREDVEFINSVPDTLYAMVIVYGITIFEAFMTDITKILMTFYWKALRSKDRTMTYEEILSFEDIAALRERMIENDIMQFSYGGLRNKVSYLEKKLGLKFSYVRVKGIRDNWNSLEMDELVELHSARNLIVHNSGIVNHIYLKEVRTSSYQLNEPLKITKDYALDALFLLFRVRSSITSVAMAKIKGKI